MEKNLKQLFEEYINECQYTTGLSLETIRGSRNTFELLIKIMPEISSVKELTTQILNEFFKRLHTRQRIVGKGTIRVGIKNSSIKTYYNKLNPLFTWLLNKTYIEKNPLKEIKRPKVRYDDFRRLEDSDVAKIYSAISQNHINSLMFRRDNMMVSMLLFTGVRKGELISLKVTDIDMYKKEVTIRGETSKSRKTRTLKMHLTLVMHLKEYFSERKTLGLKTEYLFVSNRGDRGLGREGLKHWVNSLIKKSGVRFSLHWFRHTFACKLVEANVHIFNIQKMMGHSDVKMTMRYARSMKTEDMGEDICKISF